MRAFLERLYRVPLWLRCQQKDRLGMNKYTKPSSRVQYCKDCGKPVIFLKDGRCDECCSAAYKVPIQDETTEKDGE